MVGLDWNKAEGRGEVHQPLLISTFPAHTGSQQPER